MKGRKANDLTGQRFGRLTVLCRVENKNKRVRFKCKCDCGKEVIVLNDENTELQNKLDNLKSYNNVDKTMKSSNLLHKAKDVIEVQEGKTTTSNLSIDLMNEKQSFKWSLGY